MPDKIKMATLFEQYALDAMILSSPENVFYVSGLPVRHIEHNPALFNVSNQYPIWIVVDKNCYTFLISWAPVLVDGNAQVDESEGISSRSEALDALRKFVKRNNLSEGRIGLEERCPLYLFEFLKGAFPKLTLKTEERIMFDLRRTKNEREIALLKKAAKIASEAIRVVTEQAKAGMIDSELVEMCKKSMIDNGAVGWDHLSLSAGGGTGLFPVRGYKLKTGDLIGTDFGSVYGGYSSDMNRLTVLGPAQSDLKDLYRIIVEIQDLCVKKIRPGVVVEEIYDTGMSAFNEYQIVQTANMFGHSIGIQTEENPLIKSGSSLKFEKNMVFAVEIYSKTKNGQYIGIEDMYLVNDFGTERITTLDRDLFEI